MKRTSRSASTAQVWRPDPSARSRFRGFTLVELLVVISIIALLAGLLLPVILGAIKRAEVAKADGEVKAIAAAVEHYQVEYSKYPGQNAGTSDKQYTSTDYKNLIATLTGSNINWNSANSNPRGIVFLSVDQKSYATNNTGGNAQTGDLADPWGNRFEVVADWNFDNKIDNPGNLADGENVYNRGVAVWSYGPKGSATVNKSEGTHIRSWR